jgi:hypothetical protein
MAKISPRFPSAKTVLATAGLATLAATFGTLSAPVSVRIDGRRMISDVPPVTTTKGTYLPLRIVAESLGADTNYDAKTGTIELTRGGNTLRLRSGDRIATLNGQTMTLRSAPFSVRGRTMVPTTTIARAFNTRVHYDPSHAVVDVMTTAGDEAVAASTDAP